MCLCYSHHQISGLSIKSKMMVWKSICEDIFCFDLHGQTLIFCRESLTIKFHVKHLFTTSFLGTFAFMMNQRSSKKKQTNMWYQIASTDSNQRTNSCKIYTTDMQLCPTYKMASRTLKRHITMILGFWHWDFNKGCQTHNFVEFPRSVSSLEFSRVKKWQT